MYLHYTGGQWLSVSGPALKTSINNFFMVSDAEGWIVAGGGVLVHCHNGVWSIYHS